jgi:hypothetical protein
MLMSKLMTRYVRLQLELTGTEVRAFSGVEVVVEVCTISNRELTRDRGKEVCLCPCKGEVMTGRRCENFREYIFRVNKIWVPVSCKNFRLE